MSQGEIKQGGIVVFWHAGKARRAQLNDNLRQIGLERYTPEPRTPFAVLKDSVETNFKDGNYLVRATEDDNCIAVVEECKGSDKNTYQHTATVKISDGIIKADSYDPFLTSKIQTSYEAIKDVLHPTSATTALVKIVKDLAGTPLRPHGGIYWLLDKHESIWSNVVQAFQSSGETVAYTLRIKYDGDLLRAVSDAIETELTSELVAIKQELSTGDLGERAVKTRQEKIKLLGEKLETYESFLGSKVSNISETLKETLDAAALHILLASTAEPEAVQA